MVDEKQFASSWLYSRSCVKVQVISDVQEAVICKNISKRLLNDKFLLIGPWLRLTRTLIDKKKLKSNVFRLYGFLTSPTNKITLLDRNMNKNGWSILQFSGGLINFFVYRIRTAIKQKAGFTCFEQITLYMTDIVPKCK